MTETINGVLCTVDSTTLQINQFVDDISEQLEDHLAAINENTNELQSNYQFLCELDEKINKLSEKIDQIQLFLEKNNGFIASKAAKFDVKALTKLEKDVFLVFYMLDEKGPVSYLELARRAGLTEEMVCQLITSLIEKGVPISKQYNLKRYIFSS